MHVRNTWLAAHGLAQGQRREGPFAEFTLGCTDAVHRRDATRYEVKRTALFHPLTPTPVGLVLPRLPSGGRGSRLRPAWAGKPSSSPSRGPRGGQDRSRSV